VHDGIGPAADHVLVALWHTKQPAEHRHRQAGGVVADDVDPPRRQVRLEQLARELAEGALERRDCGAREEPVRQVSQTRVIGRIGVDEERQLSLEGLERRALRARKDPVVARRREAVDIARQRPEAVPLVVVGRPSSRRRR
jgi:hypothetical protein